MNQKLVDYLENSFIGSYLKNPNITDITYNGKTFFYMDNIRGRKKAKLDITQSEVSDFIRQVANLAEKQFSYSEPYMDFSVSRYRINAVHSSIGRNGDEKVVTFCIRIASIKNKIQNDSSFIPISQIQYLKDSLKQKQSIVIAGATGSGKTELQKYLINLLEPNTRVIVIDNVQELECLRENEDLDLTSWQVNQKDQQRCFESLIRNALRSNPDWLIVSESRGQEMSDTLLSVMTGHPIITTLHAYTLEEIPHRITRMVLLANQNQKYEDVYNDVVNHFQTYVYLTREISKDGKVHRYVSKMGQIDPKTKKIRTIFERNSYEEA